MPSFHVIALDENLSKVGELKRVRSIDVDRSIMERSPLLESCSIDVDCDAIPDQGWYRIERHGASGREALGTFFLATESVEVSRGVMTARLIGKSVLSPAAEAVVAGGSFARSGTDVRLLVSQLLSECPSSVTSSVSAKVPHSIVFSPNSTALDAAWRVLDAVGMYIRLDGFGNIRLDRYPTEPSFTLTETARRVLPGIGVASDGVTYSREYDDATYPGDLAEVRLERYGSFFDGRILSQSFSAGPSMSMTEKIGVLAR